MVILEPVPLQPILGDCFIIARNIPGIKQKNLMYKFRYVEMGSGLHWQPGVRKLSYFVNNMSNFLNAAG
jgi:hypothetical protein